MPVRIQPHQIFQYIALKPQYNKDYPKDDQNRAN